MDKSKWPQAWKDQYNKVIRERKLETDLKRERQAALDASQFPQLWQLKISEENLFPLIAYEFPLHRVLASLLQKFIPPGSEKEILISTLYLHKAKRIFPGYYSDREREVVILNRFQNNNEWEELFDWLSFFSERGHHPHMYFMLGVIFLDKYIHQTEQKIWLHQSIRQLRRVEPWVKGEDYKKALNAVQALAHYLNRDFDQAMGYLGLRKKKTFEEDFAELMERLAA